MSADGTIFVGHQDTSVKVYRMDPSVSSDSSSHISRHTSGVSYKQPTLAGMALLPAQMLQSIVKRPMSICVIPYVQATNMLHMCYYILCNSASYVIAIRELGACHTASELAPCCLILRVCSFGVGDHANPYSCTIVCYCRMQQTASQTPAAPSGQPLIRGPVFDLLML